MVLRYFFPICLMTAGIVQAQPTPEDSLTHYQLGEIVVAAGGEENPQRQTSTLQRVSLARIAQADAASIDRVMRHIPAAHVQTNSRGETLVYLRNAGERQVALFFDGALLNVPWDNRIDLSLVPADVVGEITVAKGAPSVLYGANVLGGAINMTSRMLRRPGVFTQLSSQFGSSGSSQGNLTHLARTKHVGYALSAGYSRRDGLAVSDQASLPFSQEPEGLRTNTDNALRNLFAQVVYFGDSGARVGLSVLALDGVKGVAPEGHVDPAVSNVRFWRYPQWRTTMAIISGQAPLGKKGSMLRGALWGSRFGQRITQYKDVSYRAPLQDQEDQDDTIGTRLTLLHEAGPGVLHGALNMLTSRHRQQNSRTDGDAPGVPLAFRQHVWSSGFAYAWQGVVHMEVGASVDGLITPETGDKPPRGAQIDFGLTSGIGYALRDGWTLRGAAGRKVRFPSMRELFGEALGRFLVNPDLRPEASLVTEIALGLDRSFVSGEAVAFYNHTFDTIGQRTVAVAGEEKVRRQRINLDGSRVRGLEAVVSARLWRGFAVGGNLTWMHSRAYTNGARRRLAEKPEWLGQLSVSLHSPGGWYALMETVLTGRAYGLADDNTLTPLPTSIVINARLAYLLIHGRWAAEAFTRVNNATDDVAWSQLGLPGPGRELNAGLQVSF